MRAQYGALGIFLSAIALLPVQAQHQYASPLNNVILGRRQQCPAEYNSCDSLGQDFAGTCCPFGQKCSRDQNKQPACCPASAICTGTAPASQGTPAPSFVTNSLFNFPAIATSFSNQGACSHAWDSCSRNYDVCTSGLASGTGGFHVTIDVPGGGGTTVQPTHTTVPLESAKSVCSSLSSRACYNLQPSVCSQTGTAAPFYVGTANAQPRQTPPPHIAGIMAGVGIGFLGAQF
ncbi:uncharacterized protein PG998_001947 [Apiospora kogelbergensis]|uniref:Uncharacterized protein n=1 Tax=Apiospora kogelbergensis TaxID=1337665 RepID=A0AAW0Q531_9PEZI